jgi:hypothetical protein
MRGILVVQRTVSLFRFTLSEKSFPASGFSCFVH